MSCAPFKPGFSKKKSGYLIGDVRAGGGRAGGAFLVNVLVNLLADSIFSQSIQPAFFKFNIWLLQGLCFHVMPYSFSVGSQCFW